MSFAAASGLWLGLILLPVVALYILKIKRHRRIVPYLKLWQKLVADQQFSTLFRKLQRILSLILQLLIAICLVFAFASLTLSDSFLKEESVVLVVDTSASMSAQVARDDQRSRLELAIARARDLVEGRSAEDEFAVIAAGAEPEVLQGFTRSTLRLREAVGALRPTKARGDIDAAHRLARDLLQDKEHPRILLLADAAGGASARLAAADSDLRWMRTGEPIRNLGILRFQARKNHSVGTDYLLLVVANFGAEPARAEVEVELQGKLRKVIPIDVPPGEEFSETLPVPLPEGGFATARLIHPQGGPGDEAPEPDGFALDDVAYAAIPAGRLFSVLLVARNDAEATPFQAALGELGRLGDLVDKETSYIVDSAAWEAMEPARRAGFDLVIFVNEAPDELPEEGHFFLINALPARGIPARTRPVEAWPKIREAADDHALNRFLEPNDMHPAQALPLDLTGGEVFMETAGGPVGVVFQTERRQVVYLGLDVLSDMFFLQFAFPIAMRNVLAWMHEQDNNLLEATYAPGEVIRPRFAIADRDVVVGWRRSGGNEGKVQVPVRDGKFFFGDTAEPGHYWVLTADAGYRTSVNLFARDESDVRMPEPEAGEQLDIERAGFLFGRDLWPILLLAAALAWVLEWALFHRRITE